MNWIRRSHRRNPGPSTPLEAAEDDAPVPVAGPGPEAAVPTAPVGAAATDAEPTPPPGLVLPGAAPPPSPGPLLVPASAADSLPGPELSAAPSPRPALATAPPVLDSVDQAPAALVDVLATFLEPVTGVPDPTVALLQVTPRSVGLGGLRGLQTVGPFAVQELLGGQLEAVVRFQVWGLAADAANQQMLGLQGRLLAARSALFNAGVLEVAGVAGDLPHEDGTAWSRTADYRVLFEYQLAPTAADSLVARIRIRTSQEVDGALVGDTTIVTDDLVRWDNEEASPLVVRGTRTVARLAAASFVAGAQPGGAVSILRSNDAAAGPPQTYGTLADFLTAVGDPVAPQTHGEVDIPSMAEFLAAFAPAGSPFVLGDWDADGLPDSYQAGALELLPPVVLPTAQDRLEISIATSPLDQVAVVYLRAAGTLG